MENGVIEILLIEDDPDDAELTILALRKYNLANHLLHIDNGEDALKFLYEAGNDNPKLILLDLKMPRVDGIQILKALKSDSAKKDIPVIAMISSKEGKNYVESFQLKADAYISKPIDLKKFLVVIAEVGLTWKIVDSPVQGR